MATKDEIISVLMEEGNIPEDSAEIVYGRYREAGIIVMSSHVHNWHFEHPTFYEKDTILHVLNG